MKKILLGGSAIASMALLSAGAQAADPLKLSVGGYFQAYGVFMQQDDKPNRGGQDRRNFDLKREAEVHFKGETKLDNGLTVGVDVQLEAETCGDQIDESYLYFSGGWGRVIIGSENNAPYLLQVGAPAVDGNFDGVEPNYRLVNIVAPALRTTAAAGLPAPEAAAFLAGGGLAASRAQNQASRTSYSMSAIDGDSEKFTYLTPVFAGFQAGISYAPANCEESAGAQNTQNCNGTFGGANIEGGPGLVANSGNTFGALATGGPQWQDVIEIGARYNGQFGPVKLSVGGGYGWAELKGGGATNGLGQRFDDRREWNVGATVGFAGFTVGGAYYRDNVGLDGATTLAAGANRGIPSGDFQAWAAGVNYGIGAFTVGASYYRGSQEVVGGTDTHERYLVGGSYTYGPGMTFRGSVHYYDLGGPGRVIGGGRFAETADNNAWAFVLGTNINF